MVIISTRYHIRESAQKLDRIFKCRRGEEEKASRVGQKGGWGACLKSVERHAGKWGGGTCTCGSSD